MGLSALRNRRADCSTRSREGGATCRRGALAEGSKESKDFGVKRKRSNVEKQIDEIGECTWQIIEGIHDSEQAIAKVRKLGGEMVSKRYALQKQCGLDNAAVAARVGAPPCDIDFARIFAGTE